MCAWACPGRTRYTKETFMETPLKPPSERECIAIDAIIEELERLRLARIATKTTLQPDDSEKADDTD
jgi:hypothetical protein